MVCCRCVSFVVVVCSCLSVVPGSCFCLSYGVVRCLLFGVLVFDGRCCLLLVVCRVLCVAVGFVVWCFVFVARSVSLVVRCLFLVFGFCFCY